jgi:hypothetical protein
MFFLCLLLFIDHPAWFFWLELTILNLLLLILVVRQETMSRSLVEEVAQPATVR